jgi:hypothetical protein
MKDLTITPAGTFEPKRYTITVWKDSTHTNGRMLADIYFDNFMKDEDIQKVIAAITASKLEVDLDPDKVF